MNEKNKISSFSVGEDKFDICYATELFHDSLRSLWKLCFNDTDEFIDFYFKELYKSQETLTVTSDGVLIASLQMIPYQIKLGEHIFDASYISGAMTHPDYRGKGLMAQLLHVSFEEMRKKDIPLSFLIPQEEWLFGFYQKFGYFKAFPKSYKKGNISFPAYVHENFKVWDCPEQMKPDDFYDYYIRFMSRQKNVVLKTKSQLNAALQDLFMDGGRIFVLNEGFKGIAFVVPNEEKVAIKELFGETHDQELELFMAVKNYYPGKELFIASINTPENKHYAGMIKIMSGINPELVTPDIYMSMMLD